MQYLRQFIEALLYPLQALLMSPGKVAGSARKLATISLPARIAILTFVFLIMAVPAGYYYFTKADNPEARWLTPTKGIVIAALIILIPLVLYQLLRLWLEGEVSRFPDIDYAWKAGIAELKAHGLELEYTPLFLVLGSPGELQEKSLFNATKLPFRLREIPVGAAAMHWFAEPNGIYLVATNVGCLSKLAAIAKQSSNTLDSAPLGERGPANIRGTIVLDEGQPALKATPASQVFPAPAAAKPPLNIKGTMMIDSGHEDPIIPSGERMPVVLPQEIQQEQELRLEYLCYLIAKSRQPLAPLNGILTLLPYSVVQTGRREGSELQRVVKRDLTTIVRSLKLRCPVVSLVIGLEEESGFRELVRRVGRDAATAQRFGKGFSVSNPPIPEQLEAVATHACGLFEAKIYELFREKGSLSKPGNTKLYALLCKIRRTVRGPLANILANGYSSDPDSKKDSETAPLLFSGCYFAATGEAEDRQAFIKAVFDKLPAEQEELEWTDVALQQDDRYRKWSQSIMWIDGLLLISVGVMVTYKLFWPS